MSQLSELQTTIVMSQDKEEREKALEALIQMVSHSFIHNKATTIPLPGYTLVFPFLES